MTTYDHLQWWRYRQRKRWPGLFRSCIWQPITASNSSEQRCKIRVRLNRNQTAHVLINDVPVLLCEGCGNLEPMDESLSSNEMPGISSSASTCTPPDTTALPEQQVCQDCLKCTECGFSTVLPTMRRLLQLRDSSQCGPDFSSPVAFTILIEAAGISSSVKAYVGTPYHSWFLDKNCRSEGLDALLSALGLCDEQFNASLAEDVSADDELHQDQSTESAAPLPVYPYLAYGFQAEMCLNLLTADRGDVPSIPFSVSMLSTSTDTGTGSETHENENVDKQKDLIGFSQRTAEIVRTASEILKSESSDKRSHQSQKAKKRVLRLLRKLGMDYAVERSKARRFNYINHPRLDFAEGRSSQSFPSKDPVQ